MKTSFDSFCSVTQNPLAEIQKSNLFTILPEEVILNIFSFLSESMLREIGSVSKAFSVLASDNALWKSIANSILLRSEIEAKDMPFKDLCKDYMTPLKIPNDDNLAHILLPRNPKFMSKVKDMQLLNYKILSSSEAKDLLNKKDTKQLIQAIWNDISDKNFIFFHVVQQQVGDNKFDIINCTNYVVSVNSERKLMINNKLTSIPFMQNDCQILIHLYLGGINFFKSIIGANNIDGFYCAECDLKDEDLTLIDWKFKNQIFKESTKSFCYSHYVYGGVYRNFFPPSGY
jgi:hypothetical protein